MDDYEKWAKTVESDLKWAAAVEAINLKNAQKMAKLQGLSPEEIDKIAANTTDYKVYQQLIDVVNEATKTNMAQADLVAKIKQLGNTAVEVAKKVTSLAALF